MESWISAYEENNFNNINEHFGQNMHFVEGVDHRIYAFPEYEIEKFNNLSQEEKDSITENGHNELSLGLAKLNEEGVRLYVWHEGTTFLNVGKGWWSLGEKNEKICGCDLFKETKHNKNITKHS